MAAEQQVVVFAGSTYSKQPVTVVFLGTGKSGLESIRQTIPAKPLTISGTDSNVKLLINEAAIDRFVLDGEQLSLDDATVYTSYALALAPKSKISLDESVNFSVSETVTPKGPLFLHVVLPIKVVALLRAKAADKVYSALKLEAQAASITFSDTKFAAIFGRTSGVLSKAFGRASESTPEDGKFVMQLETSISEYRADLPKLKLKLDELDAAKNLVRASSRAPCLQPHPVPRPCVSSCARTGRRPRAA